MDISLQQTVRNLYDPAHSSLDVKGRVHSITHKSKHLSTQNKMHLNLQKSLMNVEKHQIKMQSKLNDSFKYNTIESSKKFKTFGKLKGFAESHHHGKSSLPSIKPHYEVDSQSYMNIKEQLTTLTPSLKNASTNLTMAQKSKRKLRKV